MIAYCLPVAAQEAAPKQKADLAFTQGCLGLAVVEISISKLLLVTSQPENVCIMTVSTSLCTCTPEGAEPCPPSLLISLLLHLSSGNSGLANSFELHHC